MGSGFDPLTWIFEQTASITLCVYKNKVLDEVLIAFSELS